MNKTNIEHPTSNAEHRRRGGAAARMKAPNPKIQIPKKLQIPSSNMAVARRRLGFAAWDFSGPWCLGFGPLTTGQPATNNLQPTTDNKP